MKDLHRHIIIGIMVFLVALPILYSLPEGPTIVSIRNETKSPTSGTMVNTSGGSITTMVLNATNQNYRWKAFVGNITGTLTLDDAAGQSVFDWALTDIVGEVYATRSPNTITWSDINCSSPTNITNEEVALNHTSNPNDNISATFSEQNHAGFFVGNIEIPTDYCYSLHTYKNNSKQTTDFEEILLHDKDSMVYATLLEDDMTGYNPNQTFDFQMIVPENGADGFTSSTPYYFYVELI